MSPSLSNINNPISTYYPAEILWSKQREGKEEKREGERSL